MSTNLIKKEKNSKKYLEIGHKNRAYPSQNTPYS